MYPDGSVGEDPVCVLGLNKNHGMEILLRLRTDDLSGFRKPLSIRKVLYHELAHNVFSDHDNNFYRLMRQIEREAEDLDYRRSGQALGGTRRPAVQRSAGGEGGAQGGSGRLGGGGDTGLWRDLDAGAMAAQAATRRRLTAEEQAIEDSCGSHRPSQSLSHALGAEAKHAG